MSDAQIGDVRLINNPTSQANAARVTSTPGVEFGIEIVNGTIGMTAGFDTAVKLSLWGGNRLDDGSPGNPETWWGNLLEAEPQFKMISRTQHLLRSMALVTSNLRRVEDAVNADLQWFVDTGIASSVDDVTASIPALNHLRITGEIVAIGDESNFKFVENWKAGATEERREVAPRGFVRPEGVSVDFGPGGRIRNVTAIAQGAGNIFALMGWCRPVGELGDNLLVLDPNSGSANRVNINVEKILLDPGVSVSLTMNDSGGAVFKTFVWRDRAPVLEWLHVVVTWDGTDVTLYLNSIDQGVPDTIGIDNPGVIADGNRRFIFSQSNSFTGLIHHGALWDVALEAAEVEQIYLNGVTGFNLAADGGLYSSAANLQHWYQLGKNSQNIGQDYGNGTTEDLLDLVGIDETDIVDEAPGV